uniref:Putative homing endonuclease n=1 Tax=viral metagenome TaxID=1070528 RepID=A0A6H1ZZP5_9ZZZZ
MSGRGHALSELPVGEMAADYAAGLTAKEVGKRYGCSYHTVLRRFHAAGMPVRQGCPRFGRIGMRDKGYPSAIDRTGKQTPIHRVCWETAHGPIPPGHNIHHLDRDTMNHALGNLVCLSLSEHGAIHAAQRWGVK